MSVQAGSHPTRSRRRAWPALDRAIAPHRVGSVTLRTTSFYTIVFVHLVVRVCAWYVDVPDLSVLGVFR